MRNLNFESVSEKPAEVNFEFLREEIKKINLELYDVFVPNLTTMRFRNGKVEYFLESKKIQKQFFNFEFDVADIYNEKIVKLFEFQEVLSLLEGIFQIKEEQGNIVIKNFVYYLIYKYIQKFNEIELNNVVDKFIQKLKTKTKTRTICYHKLFLS